MGVQLSTGERFNLFQASPGLQKCAIALGWDLPNSGEAYEMDVSAFMLGEDGKIPNEQYFVFYNNVRSPDGSLRHANGNSSGKILGDDETLYLNFTKLDPTIQEIVFIVTIHNAEERKQSFGDIKTAFIRLEDVNTGSELARYNLKEQFTSETALEFGRLYLKNGEWRFQAVGQGYNSGLQGFVDRYSPETPTEASTSLTSEPNLTEDAQVIQQFLERVEQQQASFSQATPQDVSESANLSSVSDNLEVEESQPSTITAEELLERYKAGERDFNGLNLREISLSGGELKDCNLSCANLEGAIVNQVTFSNCNLTEANFSNAVLSQSSFNYSDLTGANLTNSDLSKTKFEGTNLIRANLNNVNFSESYFSKEVKLDKADMSEANLSKASLIGVTLSQVNLSHANLRDSKLLGANFESANLEKTNLEGAICNKNTKFPEGFDLVNAKAFILSPNASLMNINLSGWNLAGIILTSSNLIGANLSKAILGYADLTQANLKQANLSQATLTDSKLLQVNLTSANLSEANLNNANLTAADLTSANLMQANLASANLAAANLGYANLKNAKLTGANFRGANLSNVNFLGVHLYKLNFSGSNLYCANLCGANLSEANLSSANLTSTDLRGANLSKANLEKANLKGARLEGANLEEAKLTGAIMPDGTTHE